MNGKIIPYGKQSIDDDDISAVIDVLKSDYLTQGPTIELFESEFARYVGSNYAIAVSNGTAALHLAVIGLGASKKIIVPTLSFVASANCAEYLGAEVELVDIDSKSWLIDLEIIERKIEANPHEYSGIIAVHFAGRVCHLEKLKTIATKHNLWILEDACHSPGGKTELTKSKAGSCEYSNAAIFSFHPVKHIACGEGGMITTNDETLANKLRILRTHGITRKQQDFLNDSNQVGGSEESFPGWYMEMQMLGYNYRMTDMQAALGVSQLKKAEKGLLRRKEIAQMYTDSFAKRPYVINQSGYQEGHAYHLYVILVERRRELYDFLRTKNIYCQIHYLPIHLMPYYKSKGWQRGDLPVAEYYYDHCISLPMFPGLTDDEIGYIISMIDEFYA